MGMRIVEEEIHTGRFGRFGRAQRLRVDLHGVAVFGPDDDHRAIRWEWIQDVVVGEHVVVRAANDAITIPGGTFGLTPAVLGNLLDRARSITQRADVIAELAGRRSPG